MPSGWADPLSWDAMRRGAACPMCADIAFPANEFSILVAELRQSYARLARNQYRRGYTVVALKRHANELFELEPRELAEYWQDVADAAAALQHVFQPIKLNYAVLGNLCPHVHCHIVPRFVEDNPHANLDMQDGEVLLPEREYDLLIADLRAHLTRGR